MTGSDVDGTRRAESLLTQLINLVRAPSQSSSDDGVKGLGWGDGLSTSLDQLHWSAPRSRLITSGIGSALLRAFQKTQNAACLDAAKSVHVFLTSNPGRLFEENDQLCLNDFVQDSIPQARLSVGALSASFGVALFQQLGETVGDYGISDRLMNGVVDKQTDEGSWPLFWTADGGDEAQDLLEHGLMLDALADYMCIAGGRFETNYRYGLQWMMDKVTAGPAGRVTRRDAAAASLSLTRAQQYWAREAKDIDFTLAASCSETAGQLSPMISLRKARLNSEDDALCLAAWARGQRYRLWDAASSD